MNSKSSEKEQEIIKGIERMERNTRLIGSDFYDIKKIDDNEFSSFFEKIGSRYKVISYDLEKNRLFLV